jgi:hypothetical protein
VTPPPVIVRPSSPNIETVGSRCTVNEDFAVIDHARAKGRTPRTIYVPAGYRHDGASVPRLAGIAIQKTDLGEVPAATHDKLYQTGGLFGLYSRAEADALFRDLMALYGVTWWKRQAAYRAVRLFGGGAWRTP